MTRRTTAPHISRAAATVANRLRHLAARLSFQVAYREATTLDDLPDPWRLLIELELENPTTEPG